MLVEAGQVLVNVTDCAVIQAVKLETRDQAPSLFHL